MRRMWKKATTLLESKKSKEKKKKDTSQAANGTDVDTPDSGQTRHAYDQPPIPETNLNVSPGTDWDTLDSGQIRHAYDQPASLTNPHPIPESNLDDPPETPPQIVPGISNQNSEQYDQGSAGQQVVHIKEITDDENLMYELKLKLDRSSETLKNHAHLATTLDVPANIRAKCKLNTMCSPTKKLFEHLEAKMPKLTVPELITAIKKIGRKDVEDKIEENITYGAESSFQVLNCKFHLMGTICDMLDECNVNKNWYDLGNELGCEKEKLDGLQCETNPTVALLGYIYDGPNPDITVGRFIEIMKEHGQENVVGILQGNGMNQKLCERVPLDSEVMSRICHTLNKSDTWRSVARTLEIPREIYEHFDPKQPSSPTEMLFTWLRASRTELTLDELCVKLREINREDIASLLEKRFYPPIF